MTYLPSCPFCRIAAGEIQPVILHEDADVMAFLDIAPVRPGHTLIITREHVETFERLPPELAGKVLSLAQQLARRMKEVYGVERVGFVFTGTDVAHAHAHVVPMHEKTDFTSARYITTPGPIEFGSEHLKVDKAVLLGEREKLGFRAA
jgi:histidine triad (HIT) family protein